MSLDYTHIVIAERSTGLEIREATLHVSADDALDEVDRSSTNPDETARFRVFALQEIRRGHVPANERLDLD